MLKWVEITRLNKCHIPTSSDSPEFFADNEGAPLGEHDSRHHHVQLHFEGFAEEHPVGSRTAPNSSGVG